MLADRIGRVRALMITVVTYAVFTVACGFAPNYETLLVFRALQGLGFGGEWAVGAILVAEYASAKHRGRTLGVDAELLGGRLGAGRDRLHRWSSASSTTTWPGACMFWTGALPALLVIWVRRSVTTRPRPRQRREQSAEKRLVRGDLQARPAAHHVLRALLSTGVQGGYYTLATWVPTYLKTERDLSVVGTGGYLTLPDLRRLHRLL